MTLTIVDQKLVAIERFSAKIASGAVSAAKKLSSSLRVPKMKIDASGRNTSGSIMNTSMALLSGRATLNPRSCLIAGAKLLIAYPSSSALFVHLIRGSFPFHLVAKDSLNHLRIRLVPTVKIFNRERYLDMPKLRIRLIKSIVRARVEMKLDESLLRLITPQILHERIDHRSLRGSDVLVNHNGGVLAENRRLRRHDFDRRFRFFHQEGFQFVSYECVAIAELESRSCFAC